MEDSKYVTYDNGHRSKSGNQMLIERFNNGKIIGDKPSIMSIRKAINTALIAKFDNLDL